MTSPACSAAGFQKVDITLWNNNAMSQEVCDREPAAKDYGLYRKLKNGKFELVSFCSRDASTGKPYTTSYVSMLFTDYQKLMKVCQPSDSQRN